MILFINTFVTERRMDSHFRRKNAYELGRTEMQIDTRYNPDRLTLFKYTLASLAIIPWKHVIIYYELDDEFKDRVEETNQYINGLFEKPKISNFRITRQKGWQAATQEILDIPGDDLIWYSDVDNHVFIDYDLELLEKIQLKLRDLKKEHKYVSCYYSHWPEMLAMTHKSKGNVIWEREIIEKGSFYTLIKWKNNDGISIVNKNLMKYWWFEHDYGERAYIITTDKIFLNADTYDQNSEFESGGIKTPEMITIVPHREFVRHSEGFPFVGIDYNSCPPVIIPEGFFENDIKIQYGCEDRKDGYTSVNPLKQNYSKVDKNGADLRCLIDEIPLFWRSRISKIEKAEHLDQNKLISGRNRAALQLACSGNANSRGDLNPWMVTKLLKFTHIRNYTNYNNILLFRDALLTWRIKDYKNYLIVLFPILLKFLAIKKSLKKIYLAKV